MQIDVWADEAAVSHPVVDKPIRAGLGGPPQFIQKYVSSAGRLRGLLSGFKGTEIY